MSRSATGVPELLRIREGTRDDVAELTALLARIHPERTDPDLGGAEAAWPRIEAQRGRALLVAEVEQRLVGTLDLLVVPSLAHSGRPWAIIENVVVEPTWRRRGIASRMLREAVDRAAAAGCYKVQLLSDRKREGAHRLYGALGFEPLAHGFRLYLDPAENPG